MESNRDKVEQLAKELFVSRIAQISIADGESAPMEGVISACWEMAEAFYSVVERVESLDYPEADGPAESGWASRYRSVVIMRAVREAVAKLEREDMVVLDVLRRICDKYGDNDWVDTADLSDVLTEHLERYLDERGGR